MKFQSLLGLFIVINIPSFWLSPLYAIDYSKSDGEQAIESFSENFGARLGEAIVFAGKAAALKARFNDDIAAARAKFYANANDKIAAREFAQKLEEKDFAYMRLYTMEGVSTYGKKRVAAFERLSGGGFDGGIHQGAFREFSAWIESLREELGAKGEKDLPAAMLLGDNIAIESALRKHQATYLAYVEARNQIELEPVEKKRIATLINRDSATGNLPKLFKQDIFYANSQFASHRDLMALYQRSIVVQKPIQVIRCTYGPLYRKAGEEFDRYQAYQVWYKTAPPNFDEWKAADHGRALLGLGGQAAASECPQSIRDGELLWRRGRDAYAGDSFEYTYGGPR